MKQHPSNVPFLRFPEFVDHWNEVTLGDIARFRRGSFPQPYGLERWYDDEFGSPFVQVFDVGENFKLKPSTKRRISREAQEFSVFVRKGTLILTLQGSIGRLAVTQYDAFVDRTLLIFESFRIDIEKDFFMYSVFRLFQKEKRRAPGGTIKTITKEVLTDFRISLPSIAEQNQIGRFLEFVDERMEQLSTKKKLLLKYKKGVMQQIFDQKVRFKDRSGKDFPDWEVKRLGENTIWASGGTPAKDVKEYWDGDIPWISASSMRGSSYSDSDLRITSKGLQNGSRLAPKGSLLILVRGSMLHKFVPIGIAVRDLAFNQDVKSIKCIDGLSPDFLLYLLIHLQNRLLNMVASTGIGAGKIDLADLKNMLVAIPTPDEQSKISDFLSAVVEEIELVDKQLELTRYFKNGLLQQMFV